MKSKYWVALLGTAVVLNGTTLRAEDSTDTDAQATIRQLKDQLEELDQKVKVLERKDELAEEAAEARKKTAPVITVGDKGFVYESADKKFQLRLRGLLQVDSRWYVDDADIQGNETFLLRRIRPTVSGKVWENFEFQITPEFSPSNNTSNFELLDAFVNVNYWKEFQVQAGKFKSPVGFERLQSGGSLWFVERGIATNLVPNRDLGVQIHGSVYDDVFHYSAGLFNGSQNGARNTRDFDDEKTIAGRVFVHPFKKFDLNELKGLGLGVAASYGNEGATAPGNFVSQGQQTFFTYGGGLPAGSSVNADGDHLRINPHGYYFYGPFGLLGEAVFEQQDVVRVGGPVGAAGKFVRADNYAWNIALAYVLTGEDASYKGVTPRKNLSFSDGTWGAFEIVARYGQLHVDDQLFETTAAGAPIFASRLTNSDQASTWGVGLNWYLNKNVKAVFNYEQTDFRGGSGAGIINSPIATTEHAILTRLQLQY